MNNPVIEPQARRKATKIITAIVPGTRLLRVPEAGHVKSFAADNSLYLNTINDFLAGI